MQTRNIERTTKNLNDLMKEGIISSFKLIMEKPYDTNATVHIQFPKPAEYIIIELDKK